MYLFNRQNFPGNDFYDRYKTTIKRSWSNSLPHFSQILSKSCSGDCVTREGEGEREETVSDRRVNNEQLLRGRTEPFVILTHVCVALTSHPHYHSSYPCVVHTHVRYMSIQLNIFSYTGDIFTFVYRYL